MKRLLSLILLVGITFAAVAQSPSKESVKLNVTIENNEALNSVCPAFAQFKVGDKVKVNNEVYTVAKGKKGRLCIKVPANENGVYKGGYPDDITFLDGEKDHHMRLVPSQRYTKGGFDRLYMPLRAEQAADNTLTFKNLCGVLRIKISGEAKLNCIKLEDNAGAYMSGYFNFDAEQGILKRRNSTAAGVYFTVLDCSNNGEGVELDSKGEEFYIVLPVGKYEKGVTVSLTDRSHHTMKCSTAPFEVALNAITDIAPIAYKPAANQIWAENFDNMVYGGNYMNGKRYKGFNPAEATGQIDSTFSGTERAVHISSYKKAGSDYIQKNWKLTPRKEKLMSLEYLINRNIADYKSLLRAQEFPGYLGIGVKDHSRGTFASPEFKNIEGIADIEISFKCATELKPTCALDLCIRNAGVVKEYWIDDVRHTLTAENYPFRNSYTENIVIHNRPMSVGKHFQDEDFKRWYTIRVVVSGATARTSFSVMGQKMGDKERNGFYIDDIEVKLLNSVPREDILRLMCYNIQNGMWADQANNYDNFVKYMNQEDIDIAVFCEASTIYYDGTNKGSKYEERYLPYKNQPYEKGKTDHLLPTGWIELAARWGHTYVQVGAHQDNYPVVVTSKYPIIKSTKLGGNEVSHGGIHAQVVVDGEVINVVGFHTWPQAWAKGVKGKEARAKSMYEYGGHITRGEEVQNFMERTILNPQYANEKHWIITGDTNCYSPLDDAEFDLGYTNPRYMAHRYILENVPQVKDLIKFYYSPDKRDVLIPSTMRGGRIDMIYGSDKFVKTMIRARSPKTGFTNGKYDKETRFYKDRGSDHLPLIIDCKWR